MNTLPHYEPQYDDGSLYVDVDSLIKFVLDSDVKLPENTPQTAGSASKRKRDEVEGESSNVKRFGDFLLFLVAWFFVLELELFFFVNVILGKRQNDLYRDRQAAKLQKKAKQENIQ